MKSLLLIVLIVVSLGGPLQAKDLRIISLYPAHTENIASLGGGDLLIGISKSDTYPDYILHKKRFSYREDPERFIAAEPDLILVRPMIERAYPQLMKKLRGAGIKVISLQPASVSELYPYWQELADIIGKKEAGQKMIADFKSELSELTKNSTTSKNVYFESIHSRMKTFSPSSIAIFALEQAGGNNIAKDAPQIRKTNIAEYGKERLLSKSEQIDIFLAQQGRMNPININDIVEEPGFASIKAVRENQVYLIKEEIISRPTIRILEGIKQIQKIIQN
ncbi:MAG: ABC transporter substrate-binding protein [Desulfotalea sp.]